MSDLLKSGLSFGLSSSSDSENASSSSPLPSSYPEDKDNTSTALAELDSLSRSGELEKHPASVNKVIERYAEDPIILDAIARWLLRDDRAIKDENLHSACKACLKALRIAADATGDVSLAIDLRTDLRSRRYRCESQMTDASNKRGGLVKERSTKQAAMSSLDDSINRLTDTIKSTERDKASADAQLSSVSAEVKADYFSAIQICATLGFFILSILLLLDGCNRGGMDAIGGFFLAPIGGVIFGIPAGALVGLIISLVSSGVKSSNRTQAKSSAREGVKQADAILASSQSEKSRLTSERQTMSSRILAIDLEINQLDEEVMKAAARLNQLDTLIKLL